MRILRFSYYVFSLLALGLATTAYFTADNVEAQGMAMMASVAFLGVPWLVLTLIVLAVELIVWLRKPREESK